MRLQGARMSGRLRRRRKDLRADQHNRRERRLDGVRTVIHKPHVDWLALSPELALLGAAGLLLMVAVFTTPRTRSAIAAFTGFAGFVTAMVFAVVLDAKSPHATTLIHDSM